MNARCATDARVPSPMGELRGLLGLLLASTLVFAGAGRAQKRIEDEPATFSLERLRPAIDRSGVLDVEAGGGEEPGTFDAMIWLGYADSPLVLNQIRSDGDSARVGFLVANRIGASAVVSMTLLDWLEIGGELPVVLWQGRGDGVPGLALRELDALGVGDLRLVPKFRLLRVADHGLDLSLIPGVTIPLGFPANSYMGEQGATFLPAVAGSRAWGALRVAANVGAHLRPETAFFGARVSHELGFKVGAAYDLAEPTGLPLELQASASAGTTLVHPFGRANQIPVEVLGGAAWQIVPDMLQLTVGGGLGLIAGVGTPDARLFAALRFAPRDHDRDDDGIVDEQDRCPDDAEDKDAFEDSDGCPDPDNDGDGVLDVNDRCPLEPGVAKYFGCPEVDRDHDGIVDGLDRCPDEPEDDDEWQDEDGCPDPDNDEDGLLDAVDKCPYEPEDKDDFEDTDGCPDPDNDGDEILDDKDQCDDQPEDKDGDHDDDGCPDNARVVVTKKKLFALEKIYFEFGKADIRPDSMSILDEVARVLREAPEVGRVRIEGHTDDVGSDSFNLSLSQQRVERVRQYLIDKGVDSQRLEAQGFGETRPVSSNATAEGREKNRRVEFVLAGAAPPPAAPISPAAGPSPPPAAAQPEPAPPPATPKP